MQVRLIGDKSFQGLQVHVLEQHSWHIAALPQKTFLHNFVLENLPPKT